MAWIRVETRITRSRKARRLGRALGISPREARGLLVDLWAWVMEDVPSGDLSDAEPDDVAGGALWDGDPEQLWAALVESGLIDADGKVHDWQEYQGVYLSQLERQKQATAASRRRKGRPAPEPSEPDEPTAESVGTTEGAPSRYDQEDPESVVPTDPVLGTTKNSASRHDQQQGLSVRAKTAPKDRTHSNGTLRSGSGEEEDPPTPQRGEPPAEPDGGTPASTSRRKQTQAIHPQAEELVAEYEQLSGWPRGDATLRFASAALERYGPDRMRSAIASYRAELEAEPRDRKHVLRTHNWFGRDAAWKRYEGLQPAAQPEPEGPAYDRRKVLLAVRSMAESGRRTWQSEAKLVMANAGVGTLRERRELLAEAEERTRAGTWGELVEEGGA